ncbi:helix-turn-helix domain-containing protein [Streptacidiphilus sp. PB12-B1b]|nr:helix-turn-helix domain-containing protein [Streptacidiphilus sp. PB12-B1b]
MKDDSGLSLDRLAAKTGYSATSWERYLGGQTLPPFEAAVALADLAGADQVRLQVLHEAAREVWQPGPPAGPDQDAAAAEGGAVASEQPEAALPAPRPAPQGKARAPLPPGLRTVAIAALSAVAGAAIALLAVHSGHTASAAAAPVAVRATGAVVSSPATYTCRFSKRDGRWYAGNSATTSDHLQVEMSGPEVAELQCLLQRTGISPGGIDGSFGPLTELAVIREQQVQHLSVDGQIGPMTWAALRG